MDFGQFNLMGYRVPGTPAHRLYDEAVEQVRAAETSPTTASAPPR